MKGGGGLSFVSLVRSLYNYCIKNEHVVLDSKDFINRDNHILLCRGYIINPRYSPDI